MTRVRKAQIRDMVPRAGNGRAAWLAALAGCAMGVAALSPLVAQSSGGSLQLQSAGPSAAAQGSALDKGGTAPPQDDRPSWSVGFSVLEPVSVDPQNLYLVYSIPLVVREKLMGAREHELSEDERNVRRQRLVEQAVRKISGTLIRQRRERDALAAAGAATPRAARDLAKKEEQIDLLTAQIRYLEDLPLEEIDVAPSKPVEYLTSGAGVGAQEGSGLLASPRYSALATARSNDLDLLVFGGIEQVQEYLFLTVKAIDSSRGELLLDYQDAFISAETYGSLDELAGELASIVLGRAWSRLHVSAIPGEAEIRVDGEFVGVGEATLPFAKPGDFEVSVSCQGYRTDERSVSLVAGEDTALDVALEPVEVPQVAVTSLPLLADVYVDSQWVGRTPVEVPRPVGLARVQLRREGREGRALHISPVSPAETVVVLPPFTVDPGERQKSARASFYRAAGIWAVSLPIPLYLWAASLDQANAFGNALEHGAPHDQLELLVRFRRLYAGALGGVFVNASLFVNMIISLVRYMGAADRPAG